MTKIHTRSSADAPVRFGSSSISLRVEGPRTPESGLTHPSPDFDYVHKLVQRITAATNPLSEVFPDVIQFARDVVSCDDCSLYLAENGKWVPQFCEDFSAEDLELSKSYVGDVLARLLATHRVPIAISEDGPEDPELSWLDDLKDRCGETFVVVPLLSRNEVVGIMTLHHREAHVYDERQIKMLSTIGFLVGKEISKVRLQEENSRLIDRPETRKLLERAKSILQRSRAYA